MSARKMRRGAQFYLLDRTRNKFFTISHSGLTDRIENAATFTERQLLRVRQQFKIARDMSDVPVLSIRQ